MKRVLFVFLLLALTLPGGAALADDGEDSSDYVIGEIFLFEPEYLVAADGSFVLAGFVVSGFAPSKIPDAYRISWTARANGRWRSADKPNRARAGNVTVKHDRVSFVGHDGTILFHIEIGGLSIPDGQRIKVRARALYEDLKENQLGAWSATTVINYPADPASGTKSWRKSPHHLPS